MCDKSCIDFANKTLKLEDVQGKSVLEVGAYDINGSLRSIIESLQPSKYKGVDIAMGPGEDINKFDRSWNEIELIIRGNLSKLLPTSTKKFIKKNIIRIL
jgi:hypothetical protein